MKSVNKFSVLMGLIAAVAALTAVAVAVVVFFEKKKRDDEELEHYLDCAIQQWQKQ